METIVVGVDGSEGGAAALEFAMKEAALRKAALRVVTAWNIPAILVAGLAAEAAYAGDLGLESKREAERTAAQALLDVGEKHPGMKLEQVVAQGHAAKVILDHSKDASLVVVGTRGHGGFAGVLLGSVSHNVAQHSGAPVVVVPSRSKEGVS